MPDKIVMRLGALILAGGRSKRMGRPKESLAFRGGTMLERTLATVASCADPVVVVARGHDQDLTMLPASTHVVQDEQPDAGPLAALGTGLRCLQERHGFDGDTPVFVTGCDLPFLTREAVQFLLARLDTALLVIPRAGGILQPLCAIYRTRVLTAVDDLLASGMRTPRSLATKVDSRIVDEDELRALDRELRFLRNVNTPDEYRQALGDLRP